MTISPLERELLSLATEDWYSLPEALGVVRDLFPALDESDRIELARVTVSRMIENDLLLLCLFKHIGSKEIRIAKERSDDLLCDMSNWQPVPAAQWHLRFVATEKGKRIYFSLPTVS